MAKPNTAQRQTPRIPGGVIVLGPNLWAETKDGIVTLGFDSRANVGKSKERVNDKGETKGGNTLVTSSRGFVRIEGADGTAVRVSLNAIPEE